MAQTASAIKEGGLPAKSVTNAASQQAEKPAGAQDPDKQSQVQAQPPAQQAAAVPVKKTTISAKEIQADLDEWDKKLD